MLDSKTVGEVLMTQPFVDLFSNLACRWEDEKEYEDTAEYGQVLKKAIGFDFEKFQMTRRPFGFKLVTDYCWKSGEVCKTWIICKVSGSRIIVNVKEV